MDRVGVFVDAGYLLARGGLVTCGNRARSAYECTYRDLIEELRGMVEARSGMPMLRTYWYDGSHDRIPTPDHLLIGGLSFVKVRLGRIGADGKQKGVDALIYRDLMTLARERAIARAYLVAGDEDLREGVVAAQDMGVQVGLMGIAGGQSLDPSQSNDLIREADEHIVLDQDFCDRHFRPTAPVATPSAGEPADAVLGEDAVAEAERTIGETWVAAATQTEIAAVAGEVGIPREIDVQLLRQATQMLGAQRIPPVMTPALREAFKAVVSSASASG